MKFTPEEIALCKKIKEKHKRKCGTGDFVQLGSYIGGTLVNLPSQVDAWEAEGSNPIPLWQISDCMKFIENAGYKIRIDKARGSERYSVKCYGHKTKMTFYSFRLTILEALLKAVLAILEEK